MAGLTLEHRGGVAIKSYKDALQTRSTKVRPAADPIAQNDELRELRGGLVTLMKQHPDGLTLPQVRQACPHLVAPAVLKSYPSIKQLLGSFTDVVRLQGVGVQTLVLPASRHSIRGLNT